MATQLKVKNVLINKPKINQVEFLPFPHDKTVAGQLTFQLNNTSHMIILSSRFNSNGMEVNSPFPGWFLQVVNKRLSLAFGNGKTWTSLVHHEELTYGVDHKVLFSLNNELGLIRLYLNGVRCEKYHCVFKKSCDFVTLGALNTRKEFMFNGLLKDVKLGDVLEKVEIQQDTKQDFKDFVSVVDSDLQHIKESIDNFENDIESLKNIKAKILDWKLKGLEIDTMSIDKQIETLSIEKSNFVESMEKQISELQILDEQIGSGKVIVSGNIIERYNNYIQNLIEDVKIIDDSVSKLKEIQNSGVKIGNALDVVESQRQEILDMFVIVKDNLRKTKELVVNLKNKVTINE
jgi:hypothetical protein